MKTLSGAASSLLAAVIASSCFGLGTATTLSYSTLSCNTDIHTCDISTATPLSSLIEGTDSSSHVIIPCNTCAYVDYTDGEIITLPHGIDVVGRLIFPPTSNVEIELKALFVQGMLDMEKPIDGNKVVIKLYGEEEITFHPHESTGLEGVNIGFKPIVVAGGQLNINGVDTNCPSWTKLMYHMSETQLKVDPAFASCVKPGDELVITSSTTQWNDDQKVDIVSVDPVSGVIDIASPITDILPGTEKTVIPSCFKGIASGYTHCCASSCGSCGGSGCSSRPGGASKCCTGAISRTCNDVYDTACKHEDTDALEYTESEYAVEIASLSRAITFTSTVNDDIGGHLIIFHTSTVQHISGVRIENFGQSGVLGRYPIHFHKCGASSSPSSNSVVSKNVIADSNQRCVFIHDTDEVTVQDNVSHNTLGHCYATETGDERNNKFIGNLAVRTRKLHKWNGQSDSPQFMDNQHIAASFWVRSAMNEWAGNVAAGSQVQGFWLEMKNKNSNQLFDMAFRDNVAHSNAGQGLTTYRPGWKPEDGAIIDNFKAYKNGFDGLKFHNTGKVTIRNSLLADNQYHVRYGAFNSIVTLQNSTIDAMSADYKYRLNQGSDNSPHTQRGIYSSINSDVNKDDIVPDSLALHDVTFQNFKNSQTFEFYKDNRNYNTRGFGNPVNATGVSIINSEANSYPKFNCGMSYYHSYMEDDAGTLIAPDEPFHGEPGFIVAGREGMVAFLPDGSCEPISYSGSNSYQPDGCSYYCKDVCLRSVEIEPRGLHAYSKMKLVKEDGKEWTMDYNGRNKPTERVFFLVLPPGSYTGTFYDENDEVVSPEWVNVAAHSRPKCSSYVSEDDFTFTTTGLATGYCHNAASTGNVCCSSNCGGKCGGAGCCNHGSGGCAGCCAGSITSSERICEHFYDTQCLIPPEESE